MPGERPTFHSITPMIPSGPDLAAELAFYRDELGFTVDWQDGAMAGIHRDGVAFNLIENSNKDWADNASFSIGVSDLVALYTELADTTAKLGPLEEKAWGRRELHLIAPSGVCLQFYERSK